MPSLRNKDVRGDHYVTLVVQVPDKLSKEAKDLLKKFDEVTDDSLNAAKKLDKEKNGEEQPKETKKKKKFF